VREQCRRWQHRGIGGQTVTHASTLRPAWQMHDEPCEHALMSTPDLFAEIDPPEDPPLAEFMHCGANIEHEYALYRCKAGHQQRVIADRDAPIDVDELPQHVICDVCLAHRQYKRRKQ
jgi:hypothetical protein